MTRGRILLVDDDPDLRLSTAQSLDLAGFDVTDTDQPEDVPALIGFGFNGIVVTDIRMPKLDGISLMNQIHAIDREVPVILITGHSDVQLAVRAMREGAHDFIEKPFSGSQLAETCARALDYRRLVLENRVLRAAAGQKDDLEQRLVGRSNVMIDLRRRMRTIGPAETDVLITGETGTGKEIVARALHDLSARAAKPFIAIDCAALPEAQIESELFGHEPGAFPGAMRARYGRFEHARGGTVLLDDIGSMPLAVQGKLLRVIQERTIQPLGSNEVRPVDIRFIATSRSPLEAEVEAGHFRADLFYRLAVVSLTVPPLTARREDIPLLFARLLAEAAGRHRVEPTMPAPALVEALLGRDWPGNVRELRNAAERSALGLGIEAPSEQPDSGPAPGSRLSDRVAAFERDEIVRALIASGGTLKQVYESLGLSRKTLYEKMQKLGIDKSHYTDG
ncbi:sigma-54-dependent transcriptional regulator [Pararhodobacter zhoushanensis]|uniref:Sigma-54 dependent transcriptional regulator n=1 Tax=Pararhodobacter zhoushanensis TaxID=2479545 RepID=A0ABT3H379_9RHOB|nr:sigma-54 dependent transcriptional regulator [Pararhodobacter zhoushanensis]MCW1934287.1 sigma-54 dependent transcriptional regulator [Pararhodobacter zhoushanensis]